LVKPPNPGEALAATAVFEHRLLYLEYEGPISGDRGRVARWEHGTFTGEVWDEKRIVVHLSGERLRGFLRLEHAEGDAWTGDFQPGEA
jgi:hypothetical protein